MENIKFNESHYSITTLRDIIRQSHKNIRKAYGKATEINPQWEIAINQDGRVTLRIFYREHDRGDVYNVAL